MIDPAVRLAERSEALALAATPAEGGLGAAASS